LAALLSATRAGDVGALARIGEESAVRNQSRLSHPAFATLRRIARRVGAEGVCVAHSGSLCALICGDEPRAAAGALALRAEGLACTTWTVAAPGIRVRPRVPAEVGGLVPQRDPS
jgi:uncharacterized protein involved in propanediol utilization